jgi:hypothetical protein
MIVKKSYQLFKNGDFYHKEIRIIYWSSERHSAVNGRAASFPPRQAGISYSTTDR